MHAIEKILAKNSGQRQVKAGEIVTAKVGFAEINDLYLQTIYSFYEMGGEKVWDSERAAFVFDHYAPAPDMKSAANHGEMREFARKNHLKFHFDTNCAFGAMGTGCGATDMATILMTGKLWFRVPEIIEVRLEGETKKGVYPKDVILRVVGKLKADGAVYKAIDFTGSYVENLGVSGRMVICNMAVEMGAKTAYMQPNQEVLEYVSERAVRPFETQHTDPDFRSEESHTFDVSVLEPQLACPHSVDNVSSLSDVIAQGEIRLDQGYIGSCTGGRAEDIAAAAGILRGRHIAPYTRLVVVPASAAVMQECMEKGYIQELMSAGATIASPGCGACLGAHEGILAPGEVCITTTNRNFPGRMGSTKASIYLASPAVVAASMAEGRITDPRNYL